MQNDRFANQIAKRQCSRTVYNLSTDHRWPEKIAKFASNVATASAIIPAADDQLDELPAADDAGADAALPFGRVGNPNDELASARADGKWNECNLTFWGASDSAKVISQHYQFNKKQ